MGDARHFKRLLGGAVAVLAALSLAMPAGATIASDGEADDDAEEVLGGEIEPMSDNPIIGKIERDYKRSWQGTSLHRSAESTLANFVAEQVFRQARTMNALRDVDFVLFDQTDLIGDLIYSDLYHDGPGVVRRNDLRAIFADPDEKFSVVELTGEEVRQVLQEQYGYHGGSPGRRFGISQNLKYVYDWVPENIDGGPRVTINPDQIYIQHHWFQPGGRYQVIVPTWLLQDTPLNRFPTLAHATVLIEDFPMSWSEAVEQRLTRFWPEALRFTPMQQSIALYSHTRYGGPFLRPNPEVREGSLLGGMFGSLLFLSGDQVPGEHVLQVRIKERTVGRFKIYYFDDRYHFDSQGMAKVKLVMPPTNGFTSVEFLIDGKVIFWRSIKSTPNSAYHGYVDVNDGDHFAREIDWLTLAGVSTGWNNGDGTYRFGRYEPVRRDQMAAFLFRLGNLLNPRRPYIAPPESPFVDVPSSHVFYREIYWMWDRGLSTGWPVGNGKFEFRPYQPVLRDQMAAFIFRFVEKNVNPFISLGPTYTYFADMNPSRPFNKEAQWLFHSGISTGWKEGANYYFRPYQPVLRDQMAAFLTRIYEKLVAFEADANF